MQSLVLGVQSVGAPRQYDALCWLTDNVSGGLVVFTSLVNIILFLRIDAIYSKKKKGVLIALVPAACRILTSSSTINSPYPLSFPYDL